MKYQFNDKEHLHSLDGKPLTGTSSVVNVLAKPLTWWASGKAVEVLGWLNPKKSAETDRLEKAKNKLEEIKKLSVEGFIKLLDKAYRAHKDNLESTAEEGTDLHAELERFIKSEMGKKKETDFPDKIKPFIEWSMANVKKFIASEAHCFSERLWVGGIVDAVAELKSGELAIIDFKSSKEAYPSQFIQAAGYAIQIEENGLWDFGGKKNKKLENKIEKLIIVPFGANEVVPEIRCNINDFKQGFESSVVLYRLLGLEKAN